MSDISPGVSPISGTIGRATARANSYAAPSVLAPGNFTADNRSMDQTLAKLKSIKTGIEGVESAIKSMNMAGNQSVGIFSKLADFVSKAKGVMGVGSGSGLSRPSFSGSAGRTTTPASVSGGSSGGGGNRSTTAPVSAFGGGSRALALGAMGEIGSQWSGQINGFLSSNLGANMGMQVTASQANAIFGGSAGANSYNNMLAQSSQDRAAATSTLASNPFLFSAPGSRNSKNTTALITALQRLNPTIGAAGAASTVNSLASGPALQVIQRYLGGNSGVLVNPGKGDSINDPNQVFKALLTMLTGQKNLSANQLKSLSTNSFQWAAINQNIMNPGSSMAGLGITSSTVTALRQYAASGGNLTAAENAMGKTVANTALNRTSASANASAQLFQGSTGTQDAINQFYAGVSQATANVLRFVPGLAGATVGAAAFGSAALAAASKIYEAMALISATKAAGGIGGLAGGLGGIGGEAGEGGLLARLGGASGLLKAGGLALGGNIVGGLISGGQKTGSRALVGGMVRDAGIGAGLGSFFGLPGMAIGGALGAGVGALTHFLGDPVTGSTTTAGMHPSLASRVSAMMGDNPNLKITSGHRSSAQQAALYAMKGGRGVAKPGNSLHQAGLAADLGPKSQMGWLARNAGKYGLTRPDPHGEPWHVQMGDPETTDGSPPPTTMPGNWQAQVLRGLGAPATAANVKLLSSFAQSEHGSYMNWGLNQGAQNNPLDVVAPAGVSNFNYNNGYPVQNYGTPAQGIGATVSFLQGSYYSQLVAALKTGKDTYAQLQAVPRAGQWGGAGNVGATSPGVPSTGTASSSSGGVSTPSAASSPSSGGGGIAKSSKFETDLQRALSSVYLNPTNLFGSSSAQSTFGMVDQIGSNLRSALRPIASDANAQLAMLAGAAIQSGQHTTVSELKSGTSNMGDPGVSFSAGGYGGRGHVTIQMPIQVVGVTQADAQMLAQMVLAQLEKLGGLSTVGQS